MCFLIREEYNIFVKSQKAADRVMEKVSQFIEKKLKPKVNQEKSQVTKSDAVKFLGFTGVREPLPSRLKPCKRLCVKSKH